MVNYYYCAVCWPNWKRLRNLHIYKNKKKNKKVGPAIVRKMKRRIERERDRKYIFYIFLKVE